VLRTNEPRTGAKTMKFTTREKWQIAKIVGELIGSVTLIVATYYFLLS
jgi:hypothetical protein